MNAVLAPITLALLVLDGLITAVLEVLYLPLYVGSHPFPISIAVAAVVNLALVILAATRTDHGGLIIAPVGAWVLGLLLCNFSTPGGSVLMTTHEQGRTLLLLVVGLIPAIAFLAVRRVRWLAKPKSLG